MKNFFWFNRLMLRPLFDGPDSLGEFDEGSSDLDIINDETGDDTDKEDTDSEDFIDPDSNDGDSGDDDNPDDSDKEDKEDKEEEVEDSDKEEEKDEEEKPEEKEDTKVNGRTSVKAIKEKYPDFFKDFPDVRGALFSEREFRKYFGSVEDAAEASEKANHFETFSEAVSSGDTGTILDAIHDLGEKEVTKFVENFLPSLSERSRPLLAKVTAPFVQQAIKMVFDEGARLGDTPEGKNLKLAAKYVGKHLFGEDDPSKFQGGIKNEPSPEQLRLEKERKDFAKQQYDTAARDVVKVIDSRIEKDVIKLIDPNGTMNDFTRDAIVGKVVKEIGRILGEDKAHMTRLQSLWRKATKDGYSGDAKSKIISAYLSRAKQSIPAVIAKVKAQGKAKTTTPEKKGVVPGQSSKSGSKTTAISGRVDYRRTSDLDILNDNIKYVGKK